MGGFEERLERELVAAAGRSSRRGARAPLLAIGAVLVIAAALVVTLSGGSDPEHGPATRLVRGEGVSVRVPAGWRVARERLTPALANPREVLAVGSGRLIAQDARTDCAQLPSRALEALRGGEALVTLQERTPATRRYPPRPPRFGGGWDWSVTPRSQIECLPARVNARWIWFQDRGRAFYALVAIGPGSTAADGREAMGVLNSLRVTPR